MNSPKNKHTQGPWRALTIAGRVFVDAESADLPGRHGIASIAMENEACHDNARLIAAAPEMLEALEALRDEILSHGEFGDQANLAMIEAIITKACGES